MFWTLKNNYFGEKGGVRKQRVSENIRENNGSFVLKNYYYNMTECTFMSANVKLEPLWRAGGVSAQVAVVSADLEVDEVHVIVQRHLVREDLTTVLALITGDTVASVLLPLISGDLTGDEVNNDFILTCVAKVTWAIYVLPLSIKKIRLCSRIDQNGL